MTHEYKIPTPAEVDAFERQARALRAQAMAASARSAWTWIKTHAQFGARPVAHN